MRCTFYSTLVVAALFAHETKNMVEAVMVPVANPEYEEEFEGTFAELDSQRKALADDFAVELAQANLNEDKDGDGIEDNDDQVANDSSAKSSDKDGSDSSSNSSSSS